MLIQDQRQEVKESILSETEDPSQLRFCSKTSKDLKNKQSNNQLKI